MKWDDITGGQWKALGTKIGNPEVVMAILRDEMVITVEPRVKPQPQPKPALLIALPKITVLATDKFDAAKHIKVDVSRKAKVKIRYVDPSVQNDINGLIEPAQPATDLYPHKTTRYARYAEMREDLGGEKIVRTTYGKIFKLTEAQPNGEEGTLLNDGRANLFEVEVNGVGRLVRVRWSLDGWSWSSFPLDKTDGWDAGRQVFSGNSRSVVTEESR